MPNAYHASIEGAQHGAKSLEQFLDYAKNAGAAGAQPSNYMLGDGKGGFRKAKDIASAFSSRGMRLDGISAHCPFWVHTSAWTGTNRTSRSKRCSNAVSSSDQARRASPSPTSQAQPSSGCRPG